MEGGVMHEYYSDTNPGLILVASSPDPDRIIRVSISGNVHHCAPLVAVIRALLQAMEAKEAT
jgi:hypothetical protein